MPYLRTSFGTSGEPSSTRSVKITPPNFRCEVCLSLAFQRMVASHLPLLRSNRFRWWQPSEVPSLVEAVRFPRGLAVSFPRVSQVFPWEGRRYSSSEWFANRTISYLALSDRRIRTCTFRIWGWLPACRSLPINLGRQCCYISDFDTPLWWQ